MSDRVEGPEPDDRAGRLTERVIGAAAEGLVVASDEKLQLIALRDPDGIRDVAKALIEIIHAAEPLVRRTKLWEAEHSVALYRPRDSHRIDMRLGDLRRIIKAIGA
jgi:hypothetical protein